MMKKLVITTIFAVCLVFGTSIAYAQNLGVDPNEGRDPRCASESFRQNNPDICINLDTIDIPIFLTFEFVDNFTIFSYVFLAANLLFVGLTLLWIFLIVRAAVDYMQSQGDSDQIGTANKRIQSVLASVSILFFSIVGLIVLGGFLGLGNFFSWPKKFSQCDDGTLYLTKALELESVNTTGQRLTEEFIDNQCF